MAPVAALPDAGVLGVIRLPEEEDPGAGVLGERMDERRAVLGVRTGDETPFMGWLLLMGAASAAVEELLRKRRKNAK